MRSVAVRLGVLSLALALLALVRAPQPAQAVHHLAEISEIMVGFNGDANVQFVEINERGGFQNQVANTRLSAWNATGGFIGQILLITSNVPNDGDGRKWIMGTSAFETAAGIQADFEFMPVLPPGGGMVCWGAPGVSPPPNPNSWPADDPNQYVDCVAYGGYTGTTPPGNSSSSLGPGDCQRSLTRTVSADFSTVNPPNGTWADTDSSTDFALATPSPTNNGPSDGASQVGTLTATDTDSDMEADCRDNDDDNDGIKDASDNCRLVASANQTDNDNDGAGVPCDPDDNDVDFDDDGCDDGEELGENADLGGRRNPSNYWDFFDTPNTSGMRDKVITGGDIIRVVNRFGASGDQNGDPLTAPPDAPAYHTAFDRGPNKPSGWPGPADGNIVGGDIIKNVNQFGDTCVA